MNKILLGNFNHPQLLSPLKGERGGPQIKMFHGFELAETGNQYRSRVRSDILTSILIHDKLCLEMAHVGDMIDLFGFPDIKRLFGSGCLQIIDDQWMQPVIVGDGVRPYETGIVETDTSEYGSPLGYLENRLTKAFPGRKSDVRFLLLQVENHRLAFSARATVANNILNEVQYDLRNGNLTQYFSILTRDRHDVVVADIFKILRIMNVANNLIYAAEIGARNILLEGGCQQIIAQKFSPVTKLMSIRDSLALFKKILEYKKIPALNELYEKGILGVDDIIDMREDFRGRRFREWFAEADYDESFVMETLLDRKSASKNRIVQFIRWIIPNAIGLVDAIGGIVASFTDSYIIDKWVKGWQPCLFLDDSLKALIDQKIADYDLTTRQEMLKQCGKFVKEDDLCPCKSGKAFCDCCGRL